MADANNSSAKRDRKIIGKSLGLVIVISAVVVCLVAIWVYSNRPETDDATMRANFIGVAPHASGHIVQLLVKDNQFVREGDLLFTIDPRPYEHSVARAKASLVLTRKEVDSLEKAVKVAEASIVRAGAQVSASTADIERAEAQSISAEAFLQRAEGEFKEADDHFNRLEPLLSREFVTPDKIDQARTAKLAAAAGLAEARGKMDQAEQDVGDLEALRAKRDAALAARGKAELDLDFCSVRAQFDALVVNLHTSVGAFVSPGPVPVFSLVDTRAWYVIADYRETELDHIAPGMEAVVYVLTNPRYRFRGTVQGVGWAVNPEDQPITPGVPQIKRELNWVHIAQRFPVRIRIENPEPSDVFRVGASAVAIVRGWPSDGAGRTPD